MFCYSIGSSILLASLLVVGVLGCNKQCSNKEDGKAAQEPVDENKVLSEIVDIINDVCKQISEEGNNAQCNQTATIPPGLFADQQVNVTIKYTDIQLANKENELHQNKGLITTSLIFSYGNLTVTVEDGESKVIINATDNEFEATFTLKLTPGSDQVETDCFFAWNNIQVKKFLFSTTSFGPKDKTEPIAATFQREKLQEVLNTKPFLELMNKEMSICNKESFLHDITSAFILIIALKGLGSLIGNMFTDVFCV